MAPNETSALLKKNYHCNQQCTKDYCSNNSNNNNNNNNNVGVVDDGYHALDDNNHIVYINKDSSEYEPIFCLNEYYSALTLDELLPYKLDPWWQNLRRILFLTFWLILLITFLTACLLSYFQAGLNTCNILAKELSTVKIDTATTSLPTTIAEVLTTELLGVKLAAP